MGTAYCRKKKVSEKPKSTEGRPGGAEGAQKPLAADSFDALVDVKTLMADL